MCRNFQYDNPNSRNKGVGNELAPLLLQPQHFLCEFQRLQDL
jgi:hypothetical protein